MEDDSVGDDGHGHAARLCAVFLVQPFRDPRPDVRAELYGVAEMVGGGGNPPFKAVCRCVYSVFGDASVVGKAGEVRRAAGEPSGAGEAFVVRRGEPAEQGVLNTGVGVAERRTQLLTGKVAEA